MLALLDALGLDRVLLVAHDWGAFVGYRMVLGAPERFDGYLVMNMAHPWVIRARWCRICGGCGIRCRWRRSGCPLQRRTKFVERVIFGIGSDVDPEDARVFADRFRDPVCAARQRHLPHVPDYARYRSGARNPETRRATVPIRALFGTRRRRRQPCRWSRPKRRTPTTTRWRPSTPPTSSSTSDRTWCARS